MGSAYARGVLDCPRPRVGLMSLGEEETKGSELVRDVHEVLKASSLNFVGNVEGHDIFTGKVDVVVTDGFTQRGPEGLRDARRARGGSHQPGSGTRRARAGRGLPPQAAFRAPQAQRPGRDRRGALLGLKGCCVIGHGKSRGPLREARHPHRRVLPHERVNAAIEAELRALGERKEAASA